MTILILFCLDLILMTPFADVTCLLWPGPGPWGWHQSVPPGPGARKQPEEIQGGGQLTQYSPPHFLRPSPTQRLHYWCTRGRFQPPSSYSSLSTKFREFSAASSHLSFKNFIRVAKFLPNSPRCKSLLLPFEAIKFSLIVYFIFTLI